MPDLRAHLFFSYAHADEARLQPFIEQFTLKLERTLWVDKQGIERNTTWEQAIQRAIDTSYGVIFALTDAAVNSSYILNKEIEWAFERFKDIQGASLFVLLLDDVKIPTRLQTPYVTHLIDARDGDIDRAIAAFDVPDVLPEPQKSGHPFLVNWSRLANFKGRDNALLNLHRMLIGESGRAGIKTIGAVGMGGIGKTQLAVEYAHRYRFYYPAGVYWINAAADWGREIAECAEYLGLKPLDPDAPDRNGQLALAFEKYLQSQAGDALLVLDNIADPKELLTHTIGARLTMRSLSDNTRAKLLLTTRVQTMPEDIQSVEIGVLSKEDARATLFDAWTTEGRKDTPNLTSLDLLSKAVGYLPLALGWLAAALREIPELTPTELLNELRESGIDKIAGQLRAEGIDLGTPAYYEALVGVALDWSMSRLKRSESLSILILIAAYGEAAVVPIARLRLLSGLQDKGLRRPFTGAIDELQAYSLVETLADGLRLHPLTGEHIRRIYDASEMLAKEAIRLIHAYCDLEILSEAANERGFPALLDDIRLTRHVLIESNAELNELEWLLLRLEPTMIKPPKGIDKTILNKIFLVQQLQALAHNEGHTPLRDACERWLVGKLHLKTGYGIPYPADRALTRTLVAHTLDINGALLLSDGRFLSWSDDHTLRLWSNDGGELQTLQGHIDSINGALALSDGRFLSWSDDHTLRLWSNDGRALRTLQAHKDSVNGALALSDGRFLSWSDDHTLRLWSNNGEILRILQGHTRSVNNALVLPDGRFLSWSDDHTLRLWSTDGEILRILQGHTRLVKGVLILSDGRFLSWSEDSNLRIWSNKGEALKIIQGHNSSVSGALILSERRFLSWSDDHTLRLWSTDGEILKILQGHTSSVNGALILSDGRFLSWSDDHTLRLWSTDGDVITSLKKHVNAVKGVLVFPEGYFLSWSDDGSLQLWSNEGASLRSFREHTALVNGALMLSNWRFISWSSDNTLRLWSANNSNARKPKAYYYLQGHTHSVNNLLALPNNKLLSWSKDNTLRLWSANGDILQILQGHTSSVNGTLVLPDDRILSWSTDYTLRLWSANGDILQILQGHTNSVNGALVLPDKRILSWSHDNTLRLWTNEGDILRTLQGHIDIVTGATILADSRILSWSRDNTLRLWSSGGDEQRSYWGKHNWISEILTLSNGQFLSWSDDYALRLWSHESAPLRALDGHTSYVNGAIDLDDGSFLSWSVDGTIRLWSSEGDPLAVYVNGNEITTCIALGGNRFVFGDARGRVVVFEVRG